jgi:hypothetical protein
MAEWLRRWPAKPMCNACVGSNPTSVEVSFVIFFTCFLVRVTEVILCLKLGANSLILFFVQLFVVQLPQLFLGSLAFSVLVTCLSGLLFGEETTIDL